MKIIKIVLSVLILWNLPSLALFAISPSLGSALSYTTIVLLVIYYLFETKTTPNWWILILALLYLKHENEFASYHCKRILKGETFRGRKI